jgi:lysozyme family protein
VTFDEAFEHVIGSEGGYSNNPKDPGGETKFGISKRSYPNEDIRNLTLDRAREIYRRDFWDKLYLDNLPDVIRFDLFDAAVNSGVKQAIKFLQKACGVNADGKIGSITIGAANRIDPEQLDSRISGYRLLFLADLKTFPAFGRGWCRRVANNLLSD